MTHRIISLLSFLAVLSLMLGSCYKEDAYQNEAVYDTNGLGDYNNVPNQHEDGEQYNEIVENPFIKTEEEPVSTFSIDADGAAYANVRRYLSQAKQLPPANAIRTEELINYFSLDYDFNESIHPISINGEVSTCPWADGHKLIRIGMKGRPLTNQEINAPANYVFLIDVSGSMSGDDRLELLKDGFKLLVDELPSQSRVAIVTYAGGAGVHLNSTSVTEKTKIKNKINKLSAGGSTAGAAGIEKAYEIAQENFIEDGNNRIIIGTDGGFNVGISNQDELVKLIESKRDAGVFLTVVGVGKGLYNEGMLEQIANNGNGTFEYIDNTEQLKKVFIYDKSKFFTVAKDVKVQVEFNKDVVEQYRLIGYENRVLDNEDFEDDTKDAGEIGADQNITALYEIIPKENINFKTVPTFTIDFRYKLPDSDSSIPIEEEIFDKDTGFDYASEHTRFTASVAAFGLVLRDSEYKGTATYDDILKWSNNAISYDPHGFKQEFRDLVDIAKGL